MRAFRSIPLRVYRRSVGNFSSPYPSGYIQKRIQPFSNDGTMISIADAMRILLLSPNEGDTDFVLRGEWTISFKQNHFLTYPPSCRFYRWSWRSLPFTSVLKKRPVRIFLFSRIVCFWTSQRGLCNIWIIIQIWSSYRECLSSQIIIWIGPRAKVTIRALFYCKICRKTPLSYNCTFSCQADSCRRTSEAVRSTATVLLGFCKQFSVAAGKKFHCPCYDTTDKG